MKKNEGLPPISGLVEQGRTPELLMQHPAAIPAQTKAQVLSLSVITCKANSGFDAT